MYRIYHREATFVANGFEVCKTSKLLLGKVLIWLVGNCCLGGLIRGLQNLEAPGKGVRVGTFCGVQKVPQKHAEGCDPLDSRGRFKSPLDSKFR